jgi:hypothetical protein
MATFFAGALIDGIISSSSTATTQEETAELRARLQAFDQLIVPSPNHHPQRDAWNPPHHHQCPQDPQQNDASSCYSASDDRTMDHDSSGRRLGTAASPTTMTIRPTTTLDDICLARVIMLDPIMASVAIQELFRQNRAVLAIAQRQQELLQFVLPQLPQHQQSLEIVTAAAVGSYALTSTSSGIVPTSTVEGENEFSPQHHHRTPRDDDDSNDHEPCPECPVSSFSATPVDGRINCHRRSMAAANDRYRLSPFQLHLRQCLEFFEASEAYVEQQQRQVASRNPTKSKIRLLQVGIRCCFCLQQNQQPKIAAAQFPKTLRTVYQAAHLIATTHLLNNACPCLSRDMAKLLRTASKSKSNQKETVLVKRYWIESCVDKGVEERDGGLWLK